MLNKLIKSCLHMPLLVLIATGVVVVLGFKALQDNPKDAIPDISENQVIVTTDWMGRSPQDVEDQITYPLSVALQGIPKVKDVRTISGFGFSRIYVVFQDGVDTYWARSRVLERLAVASEEVPDGVKPALGPDATSLGQIFWYTVDGPHDLATLRSLQDYTIRYALQNVDGVAEVASVGGLVREYQIEVDPERLRAHSISLDQLVSAVRNSNLDVGAKTVEEGGVEFLIRGIGFVKSVEELEQVVVKTDGHVPLLLSDVARVQLGPEFRRGALADHDAEKVGGVVTMRYGANPLEVIAGVKEELKKLEPGLPKGVRINSFYDRTQLIDETLDTLQETLIAEVIITLIVVVIFLLHLRSAFIISATLPLSILLAFIGMQAFGVGSNIMSLAGIAIAIGTVVDMGIIMTETIYRAIQEDGGKSPRLKVVFDAASEVGGAILTAVLTTVFSFIPVFFLVGQSYKLFAPLAWTKTFMLLSAAIIAVTLVPVMCMMFIGGEAKHDQRTTQRQSVRRLLRPMASLGMGLLVAWVLVRFSTSVEASVGYPIFLIAVGGFVIAAAIVYRMWGERLTPIDDNPVARGIVRSYTPALAFVLKHKVIVATAFVVLLFMGAIAAFGSRTMLSPIYWTIDSVGGDSSQVAPLTALEEHYPGFGSEFMPPLDEGSLLFMPSLLSQASLSETLDVMQWQNEQIKSVPEVDKVVGKLGRADTALDPAPVGMIETVVLLKPRDEWRAGMTKKKLIAELRKATNLKGVAPSWLQPIETRIVMLSSGIRAKIGLEIHGDDVKTLEELALALEPIIKGVKGAGDVTALRTGGKPYVEFKLRRDRLAHYGLSVKQVQEVIEVALGGKRLTTTVEGRERYPVRIRYERELRDDLDEIDDILVSTPAGAQVPISELADIEYVVGPASIRGINGRLVGYVMFNPVDIDETRLIERVEKRVREAIDKGEVDWPKGYSFRWVGQYKEQQLAAERLAFIIPIALALILLLVYLHFRKLSSALFVFAGLPIGVAGGALMVRYWPWIQSLMTGDPQGAPIYMTVAVVVGFIALAGIVIDDGVVIATYIQQLYDKHKPTTVEGVRSVVLEAGRKRIRPTIMTTTTTIIALLPILWSDGRGSDVMQPMALPVVGGMAVELFTLFVVPVAMSVWLEFQVKRQERDAMSRA